MNRLSAKLKRLSVDFHRKPKPTSQRIESQPNDLSVLPTEILSLIAAELAAIADEAKYHAKREAEVYSLVNFARTCKRHFEIAYPELWRDVTYLFPLVGDARRNWMFQKDKQLAVLKKRGGYARWLTLIHDSDFTLSFNNPDKLNDLQIYRLHSNTTKLTLSFKQCLSPASSLLAIESALSLLPKLTSLTIKGHGAGSTLTSVDRDIFNAMEKEDRIWTKPCAKLVHLKVAFHGTGTITYLRLLADLLERSMETVTNFHYRPFDDVRDLNPVKIPIELRWAEAGRLTVAPNLEGLWVTFPAPEHADGFVKWLEMVTIRARDRLKVLGVNVPRGWEGKEYETGWIGTLMLNHLLPCLLSFPALTHFRITHVPKPLDMSFNRFKYRNFIVKASEEYRDALPNLLSFHWTATPVGGSYRELYDRQPGEPWPEWPEIYADAHW